MHEKRHLPYIWQLAGDFLRFLPYFKGKLRICNNTIAKFIRGKGYRTTISFDLGEKIILNLGDIISYSIFITGIYVAEKIHTEFFRKIVHRGMVILDIGAHIGYYTLQAAKRVGRKGQIHAFEPVSDTFEHLMENIRLNGFSNVFANRCIVHDHQGRMNIFVASESDTGWSQLSAMTDYRRIENVECISIDSYLEERGVQDVHLAKIDVEGCELAVLKGMSNLLKKQDHLQLLIEINDVVLKASGVSTQELFEYLQSYGFYPFLITKSGLVKIKHTDISFEPLVYFARSK